MLLVSPGDIGDSGEAFLFLSKEHMEHFIAPNALSLTLHPAYSVGDLVQMNGKYVIIEGLVDSAAKGRMGVVAADLIDVNRIQTIGTERQNRFPTLSLSSASRRMLPLGSGR